MAKAAPYARWLCMLASMRKQADDVEFEGCEEILAFINVKESSAEQVRITDLVHTLIFGTGPTVHRKVSVLAERGLIDVAASKDDARAKRLKLTKAGVSLLNERSKQMAEMLKA